MLVRRLQKMKRRENRNVALLAKFNQSQKMESIGRLAGGVAHDFNNMLTGISGAAEMLEAKMASKDPLKRYTDIILKACNRAANLTSELLVFSRNKGVDKGYMDLHECIEDSISLLAHGISRKITIRKSLKAQEFNIIGNHDMLQNMIMNLGFNAKDAMEEGGTMSIKTKNVELSSRRIQNTTHKVEPGKYVELIIKDTGAGIPKELHDKIFDPFFTTKGIGKGNGLGLPAVYGIVTNHDGTMKIDSSAKGTVFSIYFPVAKAKEKRKKKEGKIKEIKAKVLILDDEAILLELLKDMLESVGAEVITTTKPRDAIEIYEHKKDIDVVMLDVIMPTMNGIEVYEEMRKINPNVKVVLMSGYTQDKRIDGIVKNQKNVEFVRKPYMIKEVTSKLSKVLNGAE
ncbi:MAG: response regulator [Lactobacillus sp.]|jgi:nitrogen-specific signal transduction histidine kinase/CheY-like chemotaxis protein|nr:response regulator [Lactobacillus sp.]